MVLILCISASGSALLLCCLIYCRSPDKGFFMTGKAIHLGGPVVLSCEVDKSLLQKSLKVEWRKITGDSETLVHLYEDGESRQQRDGNLEMETKDGNFSLHLKKVRAEDEGFYICKVYSQQDCVDSTNTELKLGFIVKHHYTPFPLGSSVVLPSYSDKALPVEGLKVDWRRKGEALILYQDVYRNQRRVFSGEINLVLRLLGSVNETVSCCALYFRRPLLILWAAPYIRDFTGNIKTWILNYSYVADYVVLSIIVYSALFMTAWQKLLNFAEFERVLIIVLFSVVFLCCFCKIIYFLVAEIGNKSGWIINIFDLVAEMILDILPTLQFVLLFYTFGSGAGFLIVVILPVFMIMTNDRWFSRCLNLGCSYSVIKTVMIIFTLVMNAVMIGLYIMTLEKTTDPIGWGCVQVFLQILWTVMKFSDPYYYSFYRGFTRFVPVYVFGSVGFILLTSSALITELILKTVNGDRTVGDLRFIVFPVECFFAVSVVILGLFESTIKKCLQSCQKEVGSSGDKRSQQNTEETQEMKHLKTEDQEET